MPSGIWADAVATGDFNGDNRPDVVVTSTYPYTVPHDFFYVFLQKPNGMLLDTPLQLPYANHNYFITQMISKDMNHDNLDDIVIIKQDSFFIHHQSVSHAIDSNPVGHFAGFGISNIQIADLDNDGNNDIIISSHGQLFDRVFYGTSIADSFTYIDYTLPVLCYDQMKVGRIDINPELAIIHVSNTGTPGDAFATRIKNNRQLDTIIYFQQPFPITSYIDEVTTGNRFGNGIYSLAASYGGNAPSSEVLIWDHPDSLSTPNSVLPVADIPQNILMADLNCDGKDEIIVGHGAFNKVSVVSQNDSVLTFFANIPNNLNEYAMTVADVTGDGRLDIIVANTYGGLTVLQNETPELIDTVSLSTNTLSFDSTYTRFTSDTVIRKDTLFESTPLVVVTSTFIIRSSESDSVFLTSTTHMIIRICAHDTSGFADTSSIAIVNIQKDTSINRIYDTLFTAGIKNITPEKDPIKLYPNPFSDGITIDGIVETALVEIFDAKGKLIESSICENKCYLPRAGLPQGIYLLKVTEKDRVTRKKLIAL